MMSGNRTKKNMLLKHVYKVKSEICLGYYLDIHSIKSFSALFYIVLYFVVLTNFLNETGFVYKNIITTFVGFNEAKAFGRVEKFYGALLHNRIKVC